MSLSDSEVLAYRSAMSLPNAQSFGLFTRYFFQKRFNHNFIVNDHHRQIIQALADVVSGKIRRLIINMPPRYGKTELAVINFIAWCLAINPSWRFLHLSYAKDLTLENSSEIKELIQSEEYQELWPVSLRDDAKAKGKWYTEQKGGMYATSTGGQVTGFGAGILGAEGFSGAIIIDDPLKPDDADSDVRRKRINERFSNTIKSRTNNRDVPIIVIMQRIHDDDMAGHLLENDPDDWEVLQLNALQIGEDNKYKALWPWKHSVEELLALQRQDKYTFNAQYQQNPVPDDGDFFKRDRINWYENAPKHLNHYGASDYAVSEGQGDFTEHGVFGVDPDDNIYVIDWWSGQTKADAWIEEQLDLVRAHNPLKWVGETGPIKSAVEPYLTRRMRERRDYVSLEWLSHSANNKEANARSFQALWEAGRIYFPKNKPWADDLLHQLTRFPRGKYDDKVDVCSLFARLINQVWAAHKPNPEIKPQSITDQPLRVADFEPSRKTELW